VVHVQVHVLIGPRVRTVIGRSVVPPGAGSAVDDPHPAPTALETRARPAPPGASQAVTGPGVCTRHPGHSRTVTRRSHTVR